MDITVLDRAANRVPKLVRSDLKQQLPRGKKPTQNSHSRQLESGLQPNRIDSQDIRSIFPDPLRNWISRNRGFRSIEQPKITTGSSSIGDVDKKKLDQFQTSSVITCRHYRWSIAVSLSFVRRFPFLCHRVCARNSPFMGGKNRSRLIAQALWVAAFAISTRTRLH